MDESGGEGAAEPADGGRPVAVLTCGPAGAGRTTCAQALERQGYVRLVYLDVPHEVLRRRLRARRARDDADAFPVSGELLSRFLAGFEVPRGEGEEVVVVRERAP